MHRCVNMVKVQNPEIENTSKVGHKWTDEEETLLLEELNKNMDIEIISQKHNRTVGGINSRRRELAYKMYLKNVSMEEIVKRTKLDDELIRETIEKRQYNNPNKITEIIEPKKVSLEKEIIEIKNEIKNLKNTIQELVEMMKAVYEFEDV